MFPKVPFPWGLKRGEKKENRVSFVKGFSKNMVGWVRRKGWDPGDLTAAWGTPTGPLTKAPETALKGRWLSLAEAAFICIHTHEDLREMIFKDSGPDDLEGHFELNRVCL